MSADNQTPTPPADQDPAEGTDPGKPEGTPPEGDQDQGKPASRQERRDQAARERAAELEQERDQLAGRVAAMQRKEIERIAGGVLAQGADLMDIGGVKIEDLTDPETGELLDEGEILALAAALVDSRPGLSVHAEIKGGYQDWGHSRSREPIGGSESRSWSDAFGSAGRGDGRYYT